jgi:hypothetical protein
MHEEAPMGRCKTGGKLEIEIAGIGLHIITEDEGFLNELADRYEGFRNFTPERAAEYTLCLGTEERLSPGAEASPEIAVGPEGYRLLRRDFEVDVNPVRKELKGIVARNLYSFDSMLRVFFTMALLELDGLMVHSSAMVQDSRAFIFFGVSGSGKTTTAKLSSPQRAVLSDELTIIRRVNGEHRAFGTPFWGELQKNGENLSATVGGLMQLVKDTQVHLVPLRPVPALQRLLPCVLFFAKHESFVQRAVDISCRLVQDVHAYEMHFLPDESFWRLVKDVA